MMKTSPQIRRDLGCPASTGEADHRLLVVADHGAVDVREPVDLCPTEEPLLIRPACSQ
jgi:hypothetical protein